MYRRRRRAWGLSKKAKRASRKPDRPEGGSTCGPGCWYGGIVHCSCQASVRAVSGGNRSKRSTSCVLSSSSGSSPAFSEVEVAICTESPSRQLRRSHRRRRRTGRAGLGGRTSGAVISPPFQSERVREENGRESDIS
eukprot:scaffold635_cov311-Pinguiococcus_pyrenoidosus.AAC.7